MCLCDGHTNKHIQYTRRKKIDQKEFERAFIWVIGYFE